LNLMSVAVICIAEIFSFRAAQFLQVMSDSQALQESQTLSMFLATQNKIRDTIKSSLQKIEAYDDLLADVISICLSIYENQWYSTPAEKHMLIKVRLVYIMLVLPYVRRA